MSVCSGHAVCKMSRKIHCRVLEKERETLRAGTEEAVRPHCIAPLNKTVCYLSSFFSGNECLLRPRRLQKFPEKFTVGFSRKSVKTVREGTEEAVRPHCIVPLNKTVCYLSSFFSGNACPCCDTSNSVCRLTMMCSHGPI